MEQHFALDLMMTMLTMTMMMMIMMTDRNDHCDDDDDKAAIRTLLLLPYCFCLLHFLSQRSRSAQSEMAGGQAR